MHSQTYDILIIGGGMVGAALACALASSGARLALIEAKAPLTEWPADGHDPRVSAVTMGSARFFSALGAWPRMTARRVSPFREMHVWDAAGPGVIHFDSADIGAATLGYIVENRVIQAALYEQSLTFPNVEWITSARIEALHCDAECAEVSIDDGRTFNARLVVGADGADSAVRRLAGVVTRGWEYPQSALVATVKTAGGHHETAWQRFLPDGPLAFLPLDDDYSSIVWTLPHARAAQLLALDDARFRAALHEALGENIPGVAQGLGAITEVGPRASFPLRLLHADAYVRPRLALVGDAAHTVHPLAGQGVNLGLSDAAVLAELLNERLARGADPGSLSVLRRYERRRKGDNLAMAAALEGLRCLFGSRAAPLRLARNVGLQLTDAAAPLKNRIMRYAMR
ncbi:MAG: UbiH/UbiF/VisC/COQ6 family ubiquinone biosynthesis hydroxylase [Pseudomonadota bacterium]